MFPAETTSIIVKKIILGEITLVHLRVAKYLQLLSSKLKKKYNCQQRRQVINIKQDAIQKAQTLRSKQKEALVY
jgi:hypothetical protein